jgi:hypothetical protein
MSGLVLSTDFFAKTILLNVEKIPNFNQAGVFGILFIYLNYKFQQKIWIQKFSMHEIQYIM